MGATEQLVTIGAVVLGAATSYIASYGMERMRNQHELLTRWDDKKLDAYEGYIDRVRATVFLGVQLYEHREGIHLSDRSEAELKAALEQAGWDRGRSFERVMLLGGDTVIEAAHALNEAAALVDWQATAKIPGTLADWRERNRSVFAAINRFHDAAREDLGVQGRVGDAHAQRDLLLPEARRIAPTETGGSS